MLNIIRHRGNANQNHNEIALHTTNKTIVKKTENNKYWQGCGETGTFLYYWWERKMVQSLWKTAWQTLKI